MHHILLLAGTLVAGAALVFVGWRLASRRHTLPCPSWLRWMVERENPFARSNHSDFIVAHMALQPGMRVLDAGCGPGRVTLPLARAVAPAGRVVGVDLQQGMLDAVTDKARKAGIDNIDTVQAGIGRNTLPEAGFDRALIAAMLGEIPDREAALTELFRALKPGGLLAVAELVFDPHFQRRSVVTRLAHAAGFREHACFGNRLAYLMLLEKPEKA